jgi:hypothetical protein
MLTCTPQPGTHTAGRSSPAPHATLHKTVDKSVPCVHNSQADRAIDAPHIEGPGSDREIFARAFISLALPNSIANIANPSRAPARSIGTSILQSGDS